MDERLVAGPQTAELRKLGADGQRQLVDAFMSAWERHDVDGVLDLLAADARFTMPPFPAWFRGRSAIGQFLAERSFAIDWRVVPTTANGQLATAFYRREPGQERFGLAVINVLSLRDGRIAAMDAFLDPGTHRWFDLPAELVDA